MDLSWFLSSDGLANELQSPPPAADIFILASRGDTSALSSALRKGAPPDIVVNGWHAIHAAAAKNHVGCLELLLRHHGKGDLAIKTSSGETSLVLGARHGHLETVKLIIEYGGGNAISKDIALKAAAHGGHLSTCQFLVEEAGADVRSTTAEGMTACLIAAAAGQRDTFLFFASMRCGLLSVVSASGQTCLHKATSAGSLDIVNVIIAHNAALSAGEASEAVYLDETSEAGVAACHLASSGGHTRILLALAHAGADVHCLTTAGQSCLHKACFEGNIETVDVLISMGLDVDKADTNGYTPLICAASGGRSRIVERLCSSSLSVGVFAKLPSGEDAAILATSNGFKDLASKITRHQYLQMRQAALRGEAPL